MADALQQHPATLVTRLLPARARGRHLANGTERLSAVGSPYHRHVADDALTSNLSHQTGEGHIIARV
jgi:hypothetical protein